MNVDYTAYAGDTLSIAVTVTDETGTAWDVTWLTAKYILHNPLVAQTVLTKTSTAGQITLAGNVVTVNIAAGDTAGLAGTYYHELQLTDIAGQVATVVAGNVQFVQTLIDRT